MADDPARSLPDRSQSESNMATDWKAEMVDELQAVHAAVPTLPILERLEAEMANGDAEETSDELTQSQELPCTQMPQTQPRVPSPVHLDDEPVTPSQADHAQGRSEYENGQVSSGERDSPESVPEKDIPCSQAKLAKSGKASAKQPAKQRKTPPGRKPRETAAHKQEQIKLHVVQNQQELLKVSDSVDKLSQQFSLVSSQLCTLTALQRQGHHQQQAPRGANIYTDSERESSPGSSRSHARSEQRGCSHSDSGASSAVKSADRAASRPSEHSETHQRRHSSSMQPREGRSQTKSSNHGSTSRQTGGMHNSAHDGSASTHKHDSRERDLVHAARDPRKATHSISKAHDDKSRSKSVHSTARQVSTQVGESRSHASNHADSRTHARTLILCPSTSNWRQTVRCSAH